MVSVIVPVFNCAEYIAEAIASVQAQRLGDLEILVVDDGSTDATPALIARIHDSRIRTYRIERSGVSAARNVGLANAAGEFIAFLDADDRWRPEYLERQMALLRRCPSLGACFTNFVRFDEHGFFPLDQFSFYPEVRDLKAKAVPGASGFHITDDAFAQLVSWSDFPAWPQALVFRSEAIGPVRFRSDLHLCEDAAFFFQVIASTQVGYIPDALVEVRRHDGNVTKRIEDLRQAKLTALEHIITFAVNGRQRAAAVRRLSRQVVLLVQQDLMKGDWIGASSRLVHAASRRGVAAFVLQKAAAAPLRAIRRSIPLGTRRRAVHHLIARDGE